MIYFIGVVVFLFVAFTLYSTRAIGQNKVSVEDFQKKLKGTSKAQLIDVRTPSEYNSGHLKNAKNINYYDSGFRSKVTKLDKNKPVFVYCKSGVRSGNSARILKQLGFKEIYDLKGGFLAWKANKKIIVK